MSHPESCTCTTCLMADMDAHLVSVGVTPEAYAVEMTAAAERTRYATPGAACGRGRVRKVSPAQVAFIQRLMRERDTTGLIRLPGSEDVENMSLKGASDLIERLLACPVIAVKTITAGDLATEKQVAFALSLHLRKIGEVSEEIRNGYHKMTRREVSAKIDALRNLVDAPKPAATAATAEITEGMYRNPESGDIFKVQVAHHGSGNLYAKRLVKLDVPATKRGKEYAYGFAYMSGAIRTLRPEWKMTIEDAKEFGALYGCCVRCGAVLTDEGSIERGIGPICAGKF